MILEQFPVFRAEDVIPVPCHPDSLAMAYALRADRGLIPLTGLIDPQILIEGGRNTIVYEQTQDVREQVFKLFATNHSPVSAAASLRDLLCCLPRLAAPGEIGYDRIFRVLIMQFIDAHSFDLRSIKKTCVHIVHPDAKRIIPSTRSICSIATGSRRMFWRRFASASSSAQGPSSDRLARSVSARASLAAPHTLRIDLSVPVRAVAGPDDFRIHSDGGSALNEQPADRARDSGGARPGAAGAIGEARAAAKRELPSAGRRDRGVNRGAALRELLGHGLHASLLADRSAASQRPATASRGIGRSCASPALGAPGTSMMPFSSQAYLPSSTPRASR